MNESSHWWHVSFLLTLALGLQSVVQGQKLVALSGATMGTRYAVTLPEVENLSELHAKIDARLTELNKMMSTYDEESELSRFNRFDRSEWFEVSPDTAHVVRFALQVAAETDGAFDPTIGPLVNLWGFGPEGRRHAPPDDRQINKVKGRIGFQKVKARLDPPALRKVQADVYLDLSAVAKGYAVDQIVLLLEREGIDNALVAIGGDILANGHKPDGSPWQIGIEEPDAPARPYANRLKVINTAISTSGDWRNSFDYKGVRYSHVVDPATSRPVRHKVASVTVLADTSMEADAADTALLVMGDKKGLEWCEKRHVAAIFFIRGEEGEIEVKQTSHVKQKLVQ